MVKFQSDKDEKERRERLDKHHAFKQAFNAALNKNEEFQGKKLISEKKDTALAIDEERKEIHFFKAKRLKSYSFRDIIKQIRKMLIVELNRKRIHHLHLLLKK